MNAKANEHWWPNLQCDNPYMKVLGLPWVPGSCHCDIHVMHVEKVHCDSQEM